MPLYKKKTLTGLASQRGSALVKIVITHGESTLQLRPPSFGIAYAPGLSHMLISMMLKCSRLLLIHDVQPSINQINGFINQR